MIRKARGKDEWNIYSKDGKKLNKKPYKSKKAAERRLKQIEYFKHQDK